MAKEHRNHCEEGVTGERKDEMSIKNNSSSQTWWKHTEHIQIHEYRNTQTVAGQKQKQKGVKPT